jgi:hypothetical protein
VHKQARHVVWVPAIMSSVQGSVRKAICVSNGCVRSAVRAGSMDRWATAGRRWLCHVQGSVGRATHASAGCVGRVCAAINVGQ